MTIPAIAPALKPLAAVESSGVPVVEVTPTAAPVPVVAEPVDDAICVLVTPKEEMELIPPEAVRAFNTELPENVAFKAAGPKEPSVEV